MLAFARLQLRIVRQLARIPGFTLPVVVGLAFAIGATTAVFSVFSAMLLRSIGFHDARHLVAVWRADDAHGQKSVEVSYSDFVEWRKARDSVAEFALASSVNLDFPLAADGPPEYVDGTTVTGNFFRTLGATPLLGRLFSDDDDRPGEPQRVVISHRLWTTRFGADTHISGRQVQLGGSSAAIVGVARPEFDFPRGVAVWVPLRASWPGVEKNADLGVFRAVARLQPGVSPERARSRFDAIVRHSETGPSKESRGSRVAVTPMLDEFYGPAHPAVWILLGAVLLVLLIACANAANLFLNRAVQRGREFAIRASLGAGRGRLVFLLLNEASILAVAAGALGLFLANIGIKVLASIAPEDVPRIGQASIDLPVLLFGIALTFATILLFGAGPAFSASGRYPGEALKESGRGSAGSIRHARTRSLLIAAEGALSALLLVGAGLLLHSFAKLNSIDPGFQPDRLLTFRITLGGPTRQEDRRAFYASVLDRVRSLPGVESAAAILLRPLSGAVGWDTTYTVEGQPAERRNPNPNGNYEAVSPGYFRTMGIRLTSGRDFTNGDTAASPGVVIIDEATARRHWPSGDAAGKRIRLGANPQAPWLTVVGVANRVRYRQWETAWPDIYVPITQRAQHRTDFVVKTKGDPWKLVAAVRREVFAIDKNQPISNVATMDRLVDEALSHSRFNGVVMAALAACALLLAAIGIYSVLSYVVTQRKTEIGIRVALGATPLEVVKLIAAGGVRPTLAGLIAGLLAAAWLGRLMTALLSGAPGFDFAAYGIAAFALLGFAIAACIVPALRAASIDPARALQSQ